MSSSKLFILLIKVSIGTLKIQDVTPIFIKVIHDKFSLMEVYPSSFEYDRFRSRMVR